MRRILFEVSQFAPFLRSERGALQIMQSLSSVGGDPLTESDDVLADGLTVQGRDLGGANLSRWRAHGAQFRELEGREMAWQVLDGDGAHFEDCDFTAARWAMVSLREATLQGTRFATASMVLCDFSGATLRDVSFAGAKLDGCDFSHAVFENVDFSGADLRGCVMREAWLTGAKMTGAKLAGADLRGAAGLDAPARQQLAAQGARIGGAWLYRAWAKVLGGNPSLPGRHSRIRGAVTWTWAVAVSLVPILFFLRAALHPVNPDEPPFWEGSWEEPEAPPSP